MPIRDYPFTRQGKIASLSPVLPINVINPDNGFNYLTYGLIDTGACSTTIPDYGAKSLGHNVHLGPIERGFGAGGDLNIYMHTCKIEIFKMDSGGTLRSYRCPDRSNRPSGAKTGSVYP